MENSVHSVLNCMAADFAEPLGYLIAGFFPALILTGAAALVRWYLYGRNWRNKLGPIFLLVLYGYVVARQAFFSRVPGSRTGVDLEILTTWGESPQSHAYVLENHLIDF